MYKCNDCGKEYSQKPQYCDCGNTEFTETGIISVDNNDNTNKEKLYNNISVGIVIFCLIILFVSLIFIKTQKPQEQEKQIKQETQAQEVTKEEEKPALEKEQTNKKETIKEFIPLPFPSVQQKKEQPKQEQPKKETKNTAVKQNTSANKQQKDTKKPVQQTKTVQKPAQQKQIQQQKQVSSNNTQKNQVQQGTSAQSTPQKTMPPIKLNPIVPPTTPKVNNAELKKELLKYKIDLRNRISNDINFSQIIGDGSCIITFKINKDGKLTNRAFSKQSDNDSLNDAVYAAVMKNPAFNPPPEGYKNETLKLTVKIYGRNFEVDLN